MALSQSLQQKLLQKLSPQQIQLMKLLQVPTANLETRIKEELEENPALELDEEGHDENADDVKIKETGIVTFRIKEDCVPCIKTYLLTYHRGGGNVVTEEQLRGTWSTPTGKAMDGKTICEPGTIVLNRFEKATFKPELKLPPSLTKRKAELIKEIQVDTGTIKIGFFDNGQVDGDNISVYVNNMPVVSNRMLKTQPISINIRVDNIRTMHEGIMVGENLGSIPPNTPLMIITAGNKRYQLYLTSDEQKNAMARFIFEKPAAKAP